jgi:GTP-binding protein HflX
VKRIENERRTAAIVSIDSNIREIEDLADSAGVDVIFELVQWRYRPDSSTYVGRGKLEGLKGILEKRKVDHVIINGNLKPSQHYNLEKNLGVECIDRIRLVLNIFKERAETTESRLQVERATLKYEIPFLREWIHNAKAGEHPGFMAGGEYAVDVYYDLIKKRMKIIDDELLRLSKGQEVRRGQRRKRGFALVCLAGYTNAGKSSLLNVLGNDDAVVDKSMFSTLAARTRKIDNTENDVLLTDTIGFLQDLPYFMIESFKYSIDEILSTDLVLLVVDASDSTEELRRKLEASTKILFPKIGPADLMVALNKIDLVEGGIDEKIEIVRDVTGCASIVPISTVSREGIDQLIEKIDYRFKHDCKVEVRLPNKAESGGIVSWLYEVATVKKVEYGESVLLSLDCRGRDLETILMRTRAAGGMAVNTL